MVPNDVNVKSDPHRLRLILQSENVSNSATTRLKDRHNIILKKVRPSGVLMHNENASNIIIHEKIEDYCKNSSGVCKPVRLVKLFIIKIIF